uniref:Putative mitochondrial ribosome protein 63 n=1 Tax=Xenopsylla cheopis TaxID=163159 RepID=A0A6M2DJU1_XENCH
MRISQILFKTKLPNGNIFRGKYRLVKQVTQRGLEKLRKDYELEEKNMLYLRHPYLTLEQSTGHAKALRKTAAKVQLWNNTKYLKFKDHVRIEDRLNHLKVSEAWD